MTALVCDLMVLPSFREWMGLVMLDGDGLPVAAVSFALLAISALCAAWMRKERRLLFAGLLAGFLLAISLSARTYDAGPQLRIVGLPVPAVTLKWVATGNGQGAWHDYIAWPPVLVIAANFVFWLLAPSIPIAGFVRLRRRRRAGRPGMPVKEE